MAKPKPTPPRSEREYLRREMNRMGSMGRGGDWLSALVHYHPEVAAKIYKMMSEDNHRSALRSGMAPEEFEPDIFMDEAIKLWPEVVNWTGRKEA